MALSPSLQAVPMVDVFRWSYPFEICCPVVELVFVDVVDLSFQIVVSFAEHFCNKPMNKQVMLFRPVKE